MLARRTIVDRILAAMVSTLSSEMRLSDGSGDSSFTTQDLRA